MTAHLKTAWAENPAIAVHLVKRFQSQRLASEVRWQVLNFPHRVLDEPDALEILLGSQLPGDVSFQLKVRFLSRLLAMLITIVPSILGPFEPNHGSHILHARLWQPSLHYTVCNEGT